jgi:hypothetical protein
MKRLFLGIALLATASLLGGCPIYSGQQQGEYEVCSPQACYSCPTPSYSNACTAWSCQSDADCPQNYICDPNQLICLAPSTDGGSQDAEAGGDCTMTGCPSGQTCYLANGTAQCVVLGEDGSTQDSSPATPATPPTARRPTAATHPMHRTRAPHPAHATPTRTAAATGPSASTARVLHRSISARTDPSATRKASRASTASASPSARRAPPVPRAISAT